ncbi:TIGR01459 family HAD-type hydrolase [Pararhodospirillum photometricum]|uniref:HAD-superfamily subfamily IIA hydrolase n=1 Tax=Pararhodospirillum photometricum DSM 122 TaxID=1150469 RepID=H6SJK8_PARPM|nr:TIGR01459 family HAD-type hydrolase [Pararhodospirillum photometricum]CCG08173.1 HAD-superfamily subfamily IIA hydrolase [Pararhodospirillum photometricum DSM 122]
MTALRVLPGVAALAEEYDGFLLDLWGVVHDGERPYAGAIETLEHLRALGRPTVLLSNAPRLGASVVRTMEGMGIARALYTNVLTSGDAVQAALLERRDPAFAALGDACVFIGPERDHDILTGTGVTRRDDPAEASFVVCTGPVALDETEDAYRAVLEACAARGLPMVCANPDLAVMRAGRRVMCAGALARVYEGLGQSVIYRGKPDPAVFWAARDRLGGAARVAMVGDGLHTDLPGAAAAGIDAVFVAGGLNADALGVQHGALAPVEKITALLAGVRPGPVAVIPAFVWG